MNIFWFLFIFCKITYNDNMTLETYTTADVCKQLGVPRYTVTNLYKRGLIPHVKHNRFGRRTFTHEQVDLIAILIKMRSAGFSTKELRQYSRLYRQGDSTADERLAMLITRKRQLWQEIKERQESIDFIERQEELAGQKSEQEIK